MEPSSTGEGIGKPQDSASPGDLVDLGKIQALLQAEDDTKTFTGLALVKSLLDNSPQLRDDQDAIQSLWGSISAKFLRRLIRTGSASSNSNGKDMLNLAVSVMHTFSVLLPADALGESKFTRCVPLLIQAVLNSSTEIMDSLLRLLYTLSSVPQGAKTIIEVEDLSPLTEAAPSNPLVLDIILYAFLNTMSTPEGKQTLVSRVNDTIQSLVSSFKGTDSVTLLEFLGGLLRQVDSSIFPPNPQWLGAVVGYIQNLVRSRPNPEARSAYTNATASLLQVYPDDASKLLFTDDKDADKPLGYLLVHLLLIDIRSSAPSLLAKINSPEYPKISRRLASAFDTTTMFIGFLVRSLEDESMGSLVMSPDSLLKLRQTISETMSVTVEYLRDRWDASVAGAMGLHPEARSANTVTSMGTRQTLAWDSMKDAAEQDPFILSAIRALALWLREDENDSLRKEATGLTDMFMDLYTSKTSGDLDFRSPILVALEPLVTIKRGREILLQNGGWKVLAQDLANIVREPPSREDDMIRGIDVIRVLLSVVELERGGTSEEWMDLITTVAAWDLPDPSQSPRVQEFEISLLQLCCAILTNASSGTRKRYKHSISSIAGLASQLERSTKQTDPLREQLDDVLGMLSELQ
ncbi:unnamed protein product [Clonostachys chloroleuca]|uniref:Uncharacterized protein n=1 Tax=Clonostachys chloroleuca TaxID=1926264 RepID=A0AA35LW06_9HYPO|nr:unnamed protein product [Clonostachys chloroleuca]